MNKAVYSLVLSEDVVREIDKAAYSLGTNRSGLINQILADYVSYITPEERSRHILDEVRECFQDVQSFQLPDCASCSSLLLRTALSYKYNPTVRYSLELSREALPEVGTLRVSLRTQNSSLIEAMIRFYRFWDELEESEVGPQASLIEGEKYSRALRLQAPEGAAEIAIGSEELGVLIADYIRTFDSALKLYFYHLGEPQEAFPEIIRLYRKYERAERAVL